MDNITNPAGLVSTMAAEISAGRAHYFASSKSNYKVDTNLIKVMDDVKKYDRRIVKSGGFAGTAMCVFWVPAPIKSAYTISNYAPVVDGAIEIAVVDYTAELHAYEKRLKRS